MSPHNETKSPPVKAGGRGGEAAVTAALTLALFLVLCLGGPSTAKGVALAAALCAAFALILRRRQVAKRLSAPFLALCLWVGMNGASTLYAVSGKFALAAFVSMLTAFCCVVLLLAFARGEGDRLGRGFATALEGAAALAGLTSIDLLSTRLVSTPVLALLGRLTPDYAALDPVEAGVRMNGLFTNPNVFAGCMGIGVLLSLGLAGTARREGTRRFHLVCLYLNALSFLLAFSLGASGAMAVGALAYLLLERRGERGIALARMAETLVLAAGAGFVISATSLGEWTSFQPVPLACAAAGSALLCAADQLVVRRLGGLLAGRTKAAPRLAAAALVLLAAFGAAAVTWTGPASLESGESLRRAARPQPGTYTLSVAAEGAVEVTLESQTLQEAMMHTSTVLYAGPGEGAAVEVPEGSIVVYATFSAGGPATLEGAVLEGAGGAAFPLGYPLLPGFVANRLQGLWANENAIQRLVFFQDGLKLFRRSPVIGLGMGAFENGVVSVQSFHYETKFAHNHYIESLVETGLVGLLLFVGVLAAGLVAVVRSRRRPAGESHPLGACLGGALVFMAVHGGVEVVFSAYAYLPMAFGVLGLTALCCGPALPLPSVKEGARRGIVWVLAALLLIYAALLGCNLYAKDLAYRERSLDALDRAAALDRFEWADYALSYVVSSMQPGQASDEVAARAGEYARRLEKVDSNTIPLYLARYDFEMGDAGGAFAMLDKYTDYVAADPETWAQAFRLLMEYGADDPLCQAYGGELYRKMVSWDEAHMGALSLPGDAMDWLEGLGVA